MRSVAVRRALVLLATLLVLSALITVASRSGGGESGFRDEVPTSPTASASSPSTAAVRRLDRTEVLAEGEFAVSAGPLAAVELGTVSDVGVRPRVVPSRLSFRGARGQVVLADAATAVLADCNVSGLLVTITPPDGDAAREVLRFTDNGPPCGRFFGRESIFNRRLGHDAPIDAQSAAVVGELNRQVQEDYARKFGPAINASAYSTPVYSVPERQARVRVRLPPAKRSFEGPFASVPLPSDAKPAEGTDRHLVLYQPATDTMWEFFGLRRRGSQWTTEWGGRIDRVSRSSGVVPATSRGVKYGATASSLALAGGLITPADLRRGRIDHALAMALPDVRAKSWAAPALRTDGVDGSPNAVPEGAQFRLPAAMDIGALDLPPLTRMLAEAAQRYGIVIRDRSGVVSLYAQVPESRRNPLLGRVADGRNDQEILRGFPWDELQMLRLRLSS